MCEVVRPSRDLIDYQPVTRFSPKVLTDQEPERCNPSTPLTNPGGGIGFHVNSAVAGAFNDEMRKADDLAVDWLFKYFRSKGLDKQIAWLFYKKACNECVEICERLEKLCRN